MTGSQTPDDGLTHLLDEVFAVPEHSGCCVGGVTLLDELHPLHGTGDVSERTFKVGAEFHFAVGLEATRVSDTNSAGFTLNLHVHPVGGDDVC